MKMYISINWIKDFVDLTDIDIDALIYNFTMSSAEVEGSVKYGYDTKGVVVGKILSVEKLASSDKLSKVIVDIGSEQIQSICGASNIQVGDKIPFAKAGATVCGVAIASSTLDGEESHGVCLSEKELGISLDHNGVMVLDEKATIGMDIKELIPLEDTVFEVDNKSITNRPDLWGHYGIAREISAITKRPLKPLPVDDLAAYDALPKLDITVESGEDCYRYTGITVENITKNTSPYAMKVRLFYTGLRSINLLADITNYIMLEIGQPMHAFDQQMMQQVVVKTLPEETDFVTLDNVTRKLPTGTLMIQNGEKPVGIAGIMGGQETQITENTHSLFLESATFDATLIRKTAIQIGHRTDASARYEKTLDPEYAKLATARFLALLKESDPDIKVTSSFTDIYLKQYPTITITIDKPYFDRYIGKSLPLDTIVETLRNLMFDVVVTGETLTVTVPSFRATKDVSNKADLIEEVARIYGYDNIEPKSNLWAVSPIRADEVRVIEYETKRMLAERYALSEIHSYIWYNEEQNKILNIEVPDNLKIVNGLNKADSTLRANMAPTMLYYINNNLRFLPECNIFEIGRTFEYHFDNKACTEKKVLGIGLASLQKSEEVLLREVQSMMDSIMKIHKNVSVQYVSNEGTLTDSWIHPIHSYQIIVEGKEQGYLSVIHPKITDHIHKKASIVVGELRLDNINTIPTQKVVYQPISKYQTVDLDLTVIVDQTLPYQSIVEVIQTAKLNYLLGYELVDIYENEEKMPGKKSVTIRFHLGSYEKTLSKEEIDQEMNTLIDTLADHQMPIPQ